MASDTIKNWILDIKAISNWTEARDFEDKYEKGLPVVLKTITDKDAIHIDHLVVAAIENGNNRPMELIEKLLERRKLIDWKKHPNLIENWLNKLEEFGVIPESANEELYTDGAYSTFMEKVMGIIKAHKFLKRFEPKLFQLVTKSIETERNRLQITVVHIITQLDWNQHPDWMISLMEKTYDILQECAEISSRQYLSVAITTLWMMMFQKLLISQSKGAEKFASSVAKIFHFCKDKEWVDLEDSDNNTLSYELLKIIMENYLMHNCSNAQVLKPMMNDVKELWECEDDTLQQDANNIITSASAQGVEVVGEETVVTLLDSYLSGEQPHLVAQFAQMYPQNPQIFHEKIGSLLDAMQNGPDWVYLTTINLMWNIAKENTDCFTKDDIKRITDTLSVKNCESIGLMTLNALAENRAEDIAVYDEAVIDCIKMNKLSAAHGAMVLVKMAAISEKHAVKYLKVLKELVEKSDTTMSMNLLSSMRTIGSQNLDALAEYKEWFLKLKEKQALAEHVQLIIDVLEGRTLAGLSQDVSEQKEDIDRIDTRVTNTEENVTNMGNEIDRTQEQVKDVKKEVGKQGERLTDLEEVVEETVEKVEEIDSKTLSHAPSWSRDVSTLLNPKSEHDWRLLASRLGYSNEDIRNWATQPDPCLSMLDEWFATHKTKEATFAVLKALEETNRIDAAMIVENSLKQVEDIVVDEDEDYVTPPPIFISYQWGLQQEVKLLQRHLNMAGYECWMDIGQMGGGDKLFEKIDRGIRAAKVVICCVSEKYAQSPNCNREVNLSVTLGKPIIPLLMEKMSWPPPGSMGPIFGEYLFIRFFARSGENSGDDRYWPSAKYQELLMQLRYFVVPNEDMVEDLYKEWWSPPAEIIVISKTESNKDQIKTETNNNDGSVVSLSPEIFISYQWGKQPQIKALYKKLTSLGYSCWLDILQMGGGDSLYDKIDKGVRGCKVVLSCVTPKYTLSANCRREVSLADALKKPIIPLLLDPALKWPPEGPMSMVFTQLLYINFCKPDIKIQDHWDCPQMNELMLKISESAPGLMMAENKTNGENRDSQVSKDNFQEKMEENVDKPQKTSVSVTNGSDGKNSVITIDKRSKSCILL